jgi:glycosyltransferase 2 family protein
MALQLGIALLIFGFLVLTVVSQWDEIREEGVHFEVLWLLPAFCVLVGFYALGALGWDLILRFLGHRIGIGQAQVAFGQPLLARYVPGSVLYVLGRLLLAERAGVPRRTTLASLVYEQAISASAAVAVASYFFISHPDLQDQPLRWGVLLVVPAAVFVLQPRVFGPLANRLLAAFGREPLPAAMPLRGVLALLGFYALNWCVAGLGVYLVARSVRFIPFDELPVVGSAQAIGYVAALVTLVAPAGLGVRDAAFAWTVKVAVPSGSFAVGSLIAIVVRGVLTIVEVFYAGAVTALGRRHGWSLHRHASPAAPPPAEPSGPRSSTAEPGL